MEAVKAKKDGKKVIFSGKAINTPNPELVLKGNEICFEIGIEHHHVPIGCICGEWEIVEEKLDVKKGDTSKSSGSIFV